MRFNSIVPKEKKQNQTTKLQRRIKMKKLTALTTISLCTLLAATPVQAKDHIKDRTDQNVGFGSGLVIGAITAGPIGAILGAVSGAWLGDKVNEADKVEGLNEMIAENKQQMLSLQKSIALQTDQLDAAQIEISHQQAEQLKVAQDTRLMSGIKVDLMFRTNSSQLEASAIEKIAPLVLLMEQFPQFELELTGFSDKLGTKDGNQTVAEQRIQVVKHSFVNAGIDSNRIHLINRSNKKAVADLDDVEGRAFERKVSIQFMQAAEPASFAAR